MTDSAQPTHLVFATAGAFSHVPPVINLALNLLALDPLVHISIIMHVNNKNNSERLIALAGKSESTDRVTLYPVGTLGSFKDVSASFMDLVWKSGESYAAILGDTTRPAPAAFVYDMTVFIYPWVKTAVEASLPDITSPKLVGYGPLPASDMLLTAGSESNGSLRWVMPALLEKGLDIMASSAENDPFAGKECDLAALLPPADQLLPNGKICEEVVTGSGRIPLVPGALPFHLYEYWPTPIDWSGPYHHGWLQYLGHLQNTVPTPDGWLSCFPSDIFEPESFDAIQVDEAFTDGGNKPFFQTGWHEVRASDLEADMKAFLDKQQARSVVFVSFGTIVDAGVGADVLLKVLAAAKIPFVFAGGSQKSQLPATIQSLIREAEDQGRALAPDWCDQPSILHHPSILCFVSHCGLNSALESILAEVPIITGDQVGIAALIGARGLGVELIQHREGYSVGRPVAHRNDTVKGDPEVLRDEISQALSTVQGEIGGDIRRNLAEMAAEMRTRRHGVWNENLAKFVGWCRV